MSSIWFRFVFRNPQIKPRKLEEGYLLSIRRVSLSGVEIQGMLRSESQKMGTEYLPLSRLQPVRFLITRRSEDCRVRGCQEDSGIAFLRQFKITLSIIESSRENLLPLDFVSITILELCGFTAYIWPESQISPVARYCYEESLWSGQILHHFYCRSQQIFQS